MVGRAPTEGCPDNKDSKEVISLPDCNPAERLVLGSPILTHIKFCEEIFISQDRKERDSMPESPLFIPKRKTSEPFEMETESHISAEPYQQPKNRYNDPYENVVITSKSYTCHLNNQPVVYYKYTPKPYPDSDIQQQQAYNQYLYNSLYPQNPHLRLIPERTVLKPPRMPPRMPRQMPPHNQQYFSGNHMLSPKSLSPHSKTNGPKSQSLSRIEMLRNKSPNYDGTTTTSGYSSYDKTMSLNRVPTSPVTLPITSEEHSRFIMQVPSSHILTSSQTFARSKSHEKVILNQRIMKMYFCIALTACLACPPCGCWSLYQAFKVDDMIDSGNYLGAERLAKKIRRYSVVMLCIGLLWVCLAVGVFFLLLNKFRL